MAPAPRATSGGGKVINEIFAVACLAATSTACACLAIAMLAALKTLNSHRDTIADLQRRLDAIERHPAMGVDDGR